MSKKFVVAIFLAVLSMLPCLRYAKAQNATAFTYTISEGGQWIRTQDAYLPVRVLFNDSGLSKPEDIYIHDEKIYIADTGNGRILVNTLEGEHIITIGEGILESPTSVHVNVNGQILVADHALSKVALFTGTGELLKWFDRPESLLFGQDADFIPRKAVMNPRGNVFVVGEGSYNGMIHLSGQGEFLGFFGTNLVALTPLEAIQNALFTDAQRARLFHRIPKTFANVTLDEDGRVYSVTQAVSGDAIKRHSVSGRNLLYSMGDMADEANFVDMTVGDLGKIYAVTETGLIYIYDSDGNLIFSFGGRAISDERSGLFTVASGIAIDNNEAIYVLDMERGNVQVFLPTSFAQLTYQAIGLFENGEYYDGIEIWDEVLRLGGRTRIAHYGMGRSYIQLGMFEQASSSFYLAQNRMYFSQAFWEIRNVWLQRNSGNLILLFLSSYGFFLLSKKALKKETLLLCMKKSINSALYKFFSDVLFLFRFIKSPVQSFYFLRIDARGSVISATAIYLLGLTVFTFDYLFRGFLFNMRYDANMSVLYVFALFMLPILLWVICNYLASAINEGEGRLKDIYNSVAYSLAPFILFMPIVTALSHVATFNESFAIDFSGLIIYVWTALLIFIGTKEIHNYETRDTFKNMAITLLFMFIAVILYSILYMLWDQILIFLFEIVKEAVNRV